MFTGIITDIGRLRAVDQRAGADTRFEIETAYDTASIDLGASIACSGPCLTVTEKGPGWFAVEASTETLDRTTMGRWTEGTRINLERALSLGEELGGHIVTGHVDAVIETRVREAVDGSTRYAFSLPAALAHFVAEKGSVALNGVSLTVNAVSDGDDESRFEVNIIRHTQEQTTFGALAPGDAVNLEVDIFARYVGRMRDAMESKR
ncbi:MAG: riboflavin synthase [Bauldia litoralis]